MSMPYISRKEETLGIKMAGSTRTKLANGKTSAMLAKESNLKIESITLQLLEGVTSVSSDGSFLSPGNIRAGHTRFLIRTNEGTFSCTIARMGDAKPEASGIKVEIEGQFQLPDIRR
jgi:hypothetical protein